MDMKKLQYIGFRPKMTDPLYGTGEWVISESGGTVKLVPVDTARKMLKHADVWREVVEVEVVVGDKGDDSGKEEDAGDDTGDKGKEVEVIDGDKGDASDNKAEEESVQAIRDQIAAMQTKEAIANFIAANYAGYKVNGRLSLDNMKAQAVQIVDQFGVDQ